MNTSIPRLIENLEQAKTTDDWHQAIDALAQVGEVAIPELLEYVKSHHRRRWSAVMRILQKMGYSANRSGLVFMVGEASDMNSPVWETALSMLKEIGEPAIPEIRDTIMFYSQDYDDYREEFQGLCTLLVQMGSPVIEPLMPELIHLIEVGTDENHIDEYALWPIRKIGSPKADEVVPLLREKILSERGGRIRSLFIEALQDFDPLVVRPLVPVLQECLMDKSEAVQLATRKLLRLLGEV